MVVGNPKITELAYKQSHLLERAAKFAYSTVTNGLGPKHSLTSAELLRLQAQVERDYLVSLMHKESLDA